MNALRRILLSIGDELLSLGSEMNEIIVLSIMPFSWAFMTIAPTRSSINGIFTKRERVRF